MRIEKKILLIDDDPDVLSSLRSTLESAKCRVSTALNGETGYDKFIHEKPCLVICDIMMEQISTGIDIVKKMRLKNKNAKIYLLSDIGSLTANNIDVYSIGASGILQKPINPDKLLEIVKYAIE